jgi:hypothetical protein
MAAEAVFLEFGVPIDEQSRADELLQQVLGSGRQSYRHPHQRPDDESPNDATAQRPVSGQNRCAATTWTLAANMRMANNGKCKTCQNPNKRS